MAAVFSRFRWKRLPAIGAALGIVIASAAVHAVELTTLLSFDGANGMYPYAGLTADTAGNLYGTTERGGAHERGTAFKFDPGTGIITTLASFDYPDGPTARLTINNDANLYGTTVGGGASNYDGTVFKINALTGELTTLVSFNGLNGRNPYGELIADVSGNLYGATVGGGVNDAGTVFKIDPVTGVLTTITSENGSGAGLFLDTSGSLFGMNHGDGASNRGFLFKVNLATGDLTTLVSFNDANGRFPDAELIADAEGNLYGTTRWGGANDLGTIFEVNSVTGDLTTLLSFDGVNGGLPSAGVIADAAGNLYGTTSDGGASYRGTVFRFDSATGSLLTLFEFDGANGGNPVGPLIADAAGNLYGMTGNGGANDYGTVFKLTGAGFVVFVPEPAGVTLWAMSIVLLIYQGSMWRRAVR